MLSLAVRESFEPVIALSGITLAELMSLLVSWFSLASGLKHYGFMLNHIDLKLPRVSKPMTG